MSSFFLPEDDGTLHEVLLDSYLIFFWVRNARTVDSIPLVGVVSMGLGGAAMLEVKSLITRRNNHVQENLVRICLLFIKQNIQVLLTINVNEDREVIFLSMSD